MDTQQLIPVFAVIGHPNEGKSSVLSTLAEDDSVRVSPIPGETVKCQAFPVVIDGREVIRFVDTPGFQNPRRTLAWMQQHEGEEERLITDFLEVHGDDPAFRDDCELLKPVAAGAGVIFVVDGSRPVRNVDRAEMEILRLSGAPRMAVINSKEEDTAYLEQWRTAFRRHFNAIREFNSSRATYVQRIELLDSLKAIDQQWEPALRSVVEAFRQDRQARNEQTADAVTSFLMEILSYTKTVPCPKEREEEIRQALRFEYQQMVGEREGEVHREMRKLFKHNIFNIEVPEHSVLREDLFSRRTWEFLGLTDRQLIVAGALGGAAVGAGLDVAAAGISFGVFSAVGGVVGAVGTALKGKQWLSELKLLGMKLGGDQLQIGPAVNEQLLYILLDRSLLFYGHIINWAHGRRDYEASDSLDQEYKKQGYSAYWGKEERAVCRAFFRAVIREHCRADDPAVTRMREFIEGTLGRITRGEYTLKG